MYYSYYKKCKERFFILIKKHIEILPVNYFDYLLEWSGSPNIGELFRVLSCVSKSNISSLLFTLFYSSLEVGGCQRGECK